MSIVGSLPLRTIRMAEQTPIGIPPRARRGAWSGSLWCVTGRRRSLGLPGVAAFQGG
jgi:hypothetical protein